MTKGTWFKPLYEDPLSLEPEDSRNNNIEHQTGMNKKPSSKPIECMYNLDCLLYYLVQIVEYVTRIYPKKERNNLFVSKLGCM